MNSRDRFEEATELAKVALVETQKEAVADKARSIATNVDVLALVDDVAGAGDLNVPLEKNKDGKYVWREIAEASVVATDLKGSTSISYSKQGRVGARLYQTSTGGCSRVFQRFAPDFVDIQGDGLFAIFAGDLHSERALCAAISLNTFGVKLKAALKEAFGEDVPEMADRTKDWCGYRAAPGEEDWGAGRTQQARLGREAG